MNSNRSIFAALCLGLLFAVATLAQTAKVAHVSDGDSFILSSGERVRMIGINAPELKDKFGPEAKEHLAQLIGGKTVTLERDAENQDRDKYGRLLRFVRLDGRDINRQMIADGYAYAFLRYPFADERRSAYREEENVAKRAKIGIWKNEDFESPTPSVQSGPTIAVDPPADNSILGSKDKWIIAAIVVGIFLLAIRFAIRR